MTTVAVPKKAGRVLEIEKTDGGYKIVCCDTSEGIRRFDIKDDAFSNFARGLGEGQHLVSRGRMTQGEIEKHIRETDGQLSSFDHQARAQGIFCAMAMNGIWPWPAR